MATAALLRDPRAVRLSNQLRGQAAALAERGITTIPAAYVDEVADQMIAAGIDDLRGISATTAVEYGPNPSQLSMIGTEGEPFIQYGDYPVTRLFVNNVEWPITSGEKAVWNHDGTMDPFPVGVTYDGKYYVVIKWIDPPGAPLVLLVPFTRRNPWRGVAFIAGFVATAIGLPAIIGEAVLGAEIAAAYPAAANAIGTVATRTVLTGGDVESAVRSAATGFVGAEFGDVVTSAVDSEAIGAAAGAATAAALSGGDARTAALRAAISKGVNVGEIFSDNTDAGTVVDTLPPVYYGESWWRDGFTKDAISLEDLGLSIDLDSVLVNLENPDALTIPAGAVIPDESGVLYTTDGRFAEMTADAYTNGIYVDESANIRAPDNTVLLTGEESIKYLGDPEGLANALRTKIEPLQNQVLTTPIDAPAYRPASLPTPAGQTRVPVFSWADQADKLLKTAVSIGASIKAISSGTFRPPYATSPYGTARPQVPGVPVRQPDGSVVVNNGNGTQTVRYPDGRVQTIPSAYSSMGAAGNYGASLIPGVSNTALLIGGGLVLAALLISRR